MNRRLTLGHLMLIVAAVALEFGVLPTPLAVVAACLSFVFLLLTPLWRWRMLGLGSIAGLIGACLLPVTPNCSRSVQAQCRSNLHQVALALQMYHRDFGCFPPAYVADSTGRPMHSWRVLVLPYLDEQPLYAAYDLAEPWDGPNNSKLAGMMPSLYACPGNRGASKGVTSYVVIAGPGTAFPGGDTTSLADIRDDQSRTILLVESVNTSIPWLQPLDLDVRTMSLRINDPKRPSLSTLHPGGNPSIAYVDGWMNEFGESHPPKTLKALITINGGEVIDEKSFED